MVSVGGSLYSGGRFLDEAEEYRISAGLTNTVLVEGSLYGEDKDPLLILEFCMTGREDCIASNNNSWMQE